jgi:hypothetical protein
VQDRPLEQHAGWQSAYSYPSLRIWELAFSVFPPRNQGVCIQLTLSNGTVAVTVIAVPAIAVAGSGDTVTTTLGTATLLAYDVTADCTAEVEEPVVLAILAPTREALISTS